MKKSNKTRIIKKRISFQKSLIAVLTLCLLITAALAVPQAVFGIQDSLLYGESVLRPQEDIDFTALSTNYESSLYQRMRNFAEAVEKGESFYVDEKDLILTEEVADILDDAFANTLFFYLAEMGLISERVFEPVGENTEASILQYKQYVVYNDDYAQGVNFILWFLELEIEPGRKLSLLMDAQDYTVYAVKTAGNETVYQVKWAYRYYLQGWKPDLMWFTCCGYYQIFERNITEYYKSALAYLYSRLEQMDVNNMDEKSTEVMLVYAEAPYLLQIMDSSKYLPVQDTNGADVNILWREGSLYDYDGGEWVTAADNTFEMKLPYQNAAINYVVRTFGGVKEEKTGFLFPDVQCGIYELCQLIPEFQWND